MKQTPTVALAFDVSFAELNEKQFPGRGASNWSRHRIYSTLAFPYEH
jgi:hypothetical protein